MGDKIMKKNYYMTNELKQYIKSMYKKIETLANYDGIHMEIITKFEVANKGYADGEYCYSDNEGYHYRCLERGSIIEDKMVHDLFEITYLVIESHIFRMSVDYELKHRISGQDNRRLIFSKELQYFRLLGENYGKRAENEINEILKKAPFQDELFK